MLGKKIQLIQDKMEDNFIEFNLFWLKFCFFKVKFCSFKIRFYICFDVIFMNKI